MSEKNYWNKNFTEVVPKGAAGNQAYLAWFYKNARGKYERLTQAEGNQVAKNPEREEKNPIGQKGPSTTIKSYHDTHDKGVMIEKGEENYEFFKKFMDLEYIGKHAVVDCLRVDLMVEEDIPGSTHKRYLAYSYEATVQVNTLDATAGTIAVAFSQTNDTMVGTVRLPDGDDDGEHPIFTPSTKIGISTIITSASTVSVARGDSAWVEVSFSPLGCPYEFRATSSTGRCAVEGRRNSVIIVGKTVGTDTVTITSVADPNKMASISVTVT